MPRFFIDLYDGVTLLKDDTGLELESLSLARVVALRSIPDIASDLPSTGDRRVSTALVRDETGRYVFEAKLSLHVNWIDI